MKLILVVFSVIALSTAKPSGNCPSCGGGAAGGYPSGPAVAQQSSGGSYGGGQSQSSGGSYGGGPSQISSDYVRFDSGTGGGHAGSSGAVHTIHSGQSIGGGQGGAATRVFGNAGGSSYSGSGSSGSSFSGSSGGSFGGGSFQSGQVFQGQSGFLDYSSGSSGGVSKIVKPVIRHGEPIITKSYFVHAAPEEDAAGVQVEEREHIVRPRKHYNVIFIKTPLAGGNSISSNNVNVFPENEEKTVVYVLTGRNDGTQVDDNGELVIPEPKPPTKPEVVFVRYNNEQDAQRAISEIQSNYNSQEGATVNVIGAGNTAGSSSSSFGGSSGSSGSFGGASGSSGSFGGASGGSGSFGGASGGQASFGGSSGFGGGSSGGYSQGAIGGDAGFRSNVHNIGESSHNAVASGTAGGATGEVGCKRCGRNARVGQYTYVDPIQKSRELYYSTL